MRFFPAQLLLCLAFAFGILATALPQDSALQLEVPPIAASTFTGSS